MAVRGHQNGLQCVTLSAGWCTWRGGSLSETCRPWVQDQPLPSPGLWDCQQPGYVKSRTQAPVLKTQGHTVPRSLFQVPTFPLVSSWETKLQGFSDRLGCLLLMLEPSCGEKVKHRASFPSWGPTHSLSSQGSAQIRNT